MYYVIKSEQELAVLRSLPIDYRCDTCGQPIKTVDDGFVQWTTRADDIHTVLGLYVVHWMPRSPRGNCYVENTLYENLRRPQVLDTHLHAFVGTLQEWEYYQTTIEAVTEDLPMIAQLPNYPDVLRLVLEIRAAFAQRYGRRVKNVGSPSDLRWPSPACRFQILKRDGYRCQLCGRSAEDGVKLEVDHKTPRAKGGSNDQSNLWTLCYDCNRGKHTHDL